MHRHLYRSTKALHTTRITETTVLTRIAETLALDCKGICIELQRYLYWIAEVFVLNCRGTYAHPNCEGTCIGLHDMSHVHSPGLQRHDLVKMCWSLGSIQLYVSFEEYRLFYRALWQKRPIISSISCLCNPMSALQRHVHSSAKARVLTCKGSYTHPNCKGTCTGLQSRFGWVVKCPHCKGTCIQLRIAKSIWVSSYPVQVPLQFGWV